MRKLLFVMLISSIIVGTSSCEGEYGPSSSSFDPTDTIPRATALAMINHYLDAEVDHTLPAIVKQIYMDAKDIKKMLKNKHIARIKYLTAAYLASDAPAKQNKVTIIIQLKEVKKDVTTYYYYDIPSVSKVVSAKTICPPPNDCTPSIED